MDEKQKDFLVLQFQTIRAEILALKERVIRVQTVSISGIPLLIAAGENLQLDFVVIVSPIITAVAVLMLSFEQNSIMRAGRYIRLYIEPALLSINIEQNQSEQNQKQSEQNNPIGWESFLEKHGEKNRDAEKYFLGSVIIASSLYYLGGTWLAFMKIQKNYGNKIAMIFAAGYICFFPFFLYFVVQNFKMSTLHYK
jgi:hypothetical protein